MVARSALWSKSRGLFMEHASGAVSVGKCPKFNGTGINPNWEAWSPKQEPGLKLWTPTEESVAALRAWKGKYATYP